MAQAQGQITIIDYNDALTLTGFISSNHPRTQMFNPDNGTYTPSWTSTSLVLTPTLYKLGSTTDLIGTAAVTKVEWFIGASTTKISTGGGYTVGALGTPTLTVASNVMAGLPGIDYRCEITYHDPTTGLDLLHKMAISFNRVVNGSGIVTAIASAPQGMVFKNETVATLTAHVDLWRGSVIDSTSVSYEWYKQDASIVTDQGGGIGWKLLTTDVPGQYIDGDTNTLTIYAANVDSYATYKAQIKDLDPASPTYNTTFKDVVSFIDNSDPLQVVVTSTGGDVFKNGTGTTTLKAVVYRAGVEVDAGGSGTYDWTKYKNDSTLDTAWGTSGHKSGKSITVGGADVDVKATFMVTATI